jgi:uncharacterized protein (TIGR00645 family)
VGQPRPGCWCVRIIDTSSIHLLRTFIEASNIGQTGARYTDTVVARQTVIHLTFILSAIGITFVDRLGQLALTRRHKPQSAD